MSNGSTKGQGTPPYQQRQQSQRNQEPLPQQHRQQYPQQYPPLYDYPPLSQQQQQLLYQQQQIYYQPSYYPPRQQPPQQPRSQQQRSPQQQNRQQRSPQQSQQQRSPQQQSQQQRSPQRSPQSQQQRPPQSPQSPQQRPLSQLSPQQPKQQSLQRPPRTPPQQQQQSQQQQSQQSQQQSQQQRPPQSPQSPQQRPLSQSSPQPLPPQAQQLSLQNVSDTEQQFPQESPLPKRFKELIINSSQMAKDIDFENRFAEIADFLLNHSVLVIAGNKYRFKEIEFYFYSDKHPDVYTHQSEIQHTFGNWYFHTKETEFGTIYRTGKWRGLDISIGGQEGKECGGILIRTIQKVEYPVKTFCGPGFVMQHILDKVGCTEVDQLVEKLNYHLDVLEPGPLYILPNPAPALKIHTVWKSPRVGIFLTKPVHIIPLDDMTRFVFQFYRFFTEPHRIYKGKHYIVLALNEIGKNTSEISYLMDLPTKEIDDIINRRNNSWNIPIDHFVGRRLDELETCELFGALFPIHQ